MKEICKSPLQNWPSEAQQLYKNFVEQLGQRLRSAESYLQRLQHFFSYQKSQHLSFREFPLEVVATYLDAKTPRARLSHATALRVWTRFLFKHKQILLPVHKEIVYRRLTGRRRLPLTHQQVLQVLELPPLDAPEGLRDRAYLEVAYATGMRRLELASLDLGHIDLGRGLVTVRQGKNDKQRTLPLTRWAVHFLQRYLNEARPQMASPLSLNALWLGRFGRRLVKSLVGSRLNKIYRVEEVLGFPVTMHQIRHSVATALLTSGASVRSVQEFLGHVELSSTQIYTHITPDYLRQVHRRCHPRNTEIGEDGSLKNS